jgi:hypothetical protein
MVSIYFKFSWLLKKSKQRHELKLGEHRLNCSKSEGGFLWAVSYARSRWYWKLWILRENEISNFE